MFSVAESKLDRVSITTLKMVGETATTVYGLHRHRVQCHGAIRIHHTGMFCFEASLMETKGIANFRTLVPQDTLLYNHLFE